MKYFLITIDTEGDNLWSISDINTPITTNNAKYLFRFQECCERYGFIPTYLTNYEMANSKDFIELAVDRLKQGKLEIGAHEHSWNQPPLFKLNKRIGKRGKPYLSEYPENIIYDKLANLTDLLECRFNTKIKSHRGGRWCLDTRIIRQLDKLGYRVDCTCTPGVNWQSDLGWSYRGKGTDWSGQRNIVTKIEGSSLLEIPVTIMKNEKTGELIWLRPNGCNTGHMKWIIDKAIDNNLHYVEFMIHSSELMPGGSPTFKKKWEIERLYSSIEEVFSYAKENGFSGMSLTDYSEIVSFRQ